MRRASLGLALLMTLPASTLLMPAALASNCNGTSTGLVPLNDLDTGSWLGHQGGLYPGGANARPAAHTDLGLALTQLVTPRDLAGAPDPVLGKVVVLSIGMSNTRNDWSSFMALAQSDPLRNPKVQVVMGAIGGMDAERIRSPASDYWVQVDTMLLAAQASPLQVQMVWLYEAIAGPSGPADAHALRLANDLQAIVQDLKVHFPNLWHVFLGSREYAGYASSTLNPEPYAYASAFSVKWLVERQLGSPVPFATTADPADGVVMPWLSWGPYYWADGLVPRSDGLTWLCSDFNSDGTHPNAAGSLKVAQQLLGFVHTDPVASVLYEQAGAFPGPL
jgi:hypothetical protein